MTIFRFNIFYGQETEKQVRFVMANTEEEAVNKMEANRKQEIEKGYSDFSYVGGWVEMENVIY